MGWRRCARRPASTEGISATSRATVSGAARSRSWSESSGTYAWGFAIPFLAGFPPTIGVSIERACTTAMMSIHFAAMCIETGQGDAYIAGGLDSMTHFRIPVVRDGMDMSEVIKEGGTMLSAMNPN